MHFVVETRRPGRNVGEEGGAIMDSHIHSDTFVVVVAVVVVDIWIDVEEKGGFASVITRGGDC